MKPEDLPNCNVYNTLVRLVQAAGRTYLGRTTALLEHLLAPISIAYCKNLVNEYCKDSKSYTEDLKIWSQKKLEEKEQHDNYFIATADVKSLYPNVPRNLIELALKDALHTCSSLKETVIETITQLAMLCLNNSYIKFDGKLFRQNMGIVTGENNSVSLANISLHYVIKKIQAINSKTVIFRRYIDDIIYWTRSEQDLLDIQHQLNTNFSVFNLELTHNYINTGNNNLQIEFLDVLHVADNTDSNGFHITDYVKPTAEGRRFLDGSSFHPNHVFKAIITGEAKRLRRLNTKDDNYKRSIQRLKEKCYRSNFNKAITNKMIEVVQNWKILEENKTEKEVNKI